ncbi:MAG: arginine--tRNA ligase [Parcubacteria group bacterium]
MNPIAELVLEVEHATADFLSSHYGIKSPEVSLERSDNFIHGDMSTSVSMKYAKEAEESPYNLAQLIANHLNFQQLTHIKKIEVIEPGFINFFFTTSFFVKVLENIINLEADYGKNISLMNQKWIVEHTSPNPNKAMHLGHLRNNLVGMSLVRMLSWNGAVVVSDAVYNDRGIAIAKLMWGFLSHMKKNSDTPNDVAYWVSNPDKWYTPKEKNILPDIFVTQCYLLGESDFKSDENVEAIVRNFVVQWENNNKDVWELWSHVLSYAYEGMERTLLRLDNHWDKIWHEHEHYKEGKKYVQEGLKKGIFTKLEDGAVLTNLSIYDIPDTILLKKDGTSLYITQDIALVALKKKRYKADKLVWVIGPEQSLAMRQLFAVCEQLKIGKIDDFDHVSYGYVGLKDDDGGFKKMSSREGTVVLIDDLINVVKEKIKIKFTSKNNGELTEDIDELSEKLALAAIKFSILKSDRKQDLVFDTEQSIETTGDSGIYVLYTYVRAQSILRKKIKQINSPLDGQHELGLEADLVKLLAYFPEVIKTAKKDMSTHHVAQYLLELCSAFNAWYGKEIVLDGSEKESYKLTITESVGITIKNGLSILGIETVEKI